ncbi:hypothetical protein ACH5RR_031808 [Cinchona calisaya]|uniref:Fe2OG dioxygenase domain-containing protein n=1 Tax=Cinchona calisaya TaxID=153742 RepID=A0ABD2YI86_9GENT
MDFQTPSSAPIIDFTNENLISGTSIWLSTSNEVKNALENHGYFLVNYDKISSEVISAIYLAFQEFYDLPAEIKSQFTSDKPALGYFDRGPQLEVTAIGDATSKEIVEGFTNLMWSSEKKYYVCEAIHSYSKQVAELQQMILRMVFESYGLEKYYESHKESTVYIYRVNKYKAVPVNESNLGIVPHTDLTFITIIHQNQINGLEIKSKDGIWIPVDIPPNSFVVIAGDALMAWSNGRIQSRTHRVIISAEVPRYSIGMFAYKNGIVQAPNELVDEKHVLLYKPFDNFDLFSLAYKQRLLWVEDKLKFLCGI